MSKKTNMTEKLSSALQGKKDEKIPLKKTELNITDIESDVKKMSDKGTTKKMSLVVSAEIHKKVRMKTANLDCTIQDYLYDLLLVDLKTNDN